MHPSQDINRRHSLNTHFFDTICTEQQAYWLGFLWADGSWSKTSPRCSGPNRLTLCQKRAEINHLQLFLDTIEADYPIRNFNGGYGKAVIAHINSRPLCVSLERLGFARKDQRIHIPPIPPSLLHHFIRGYFDGDGCLSVYTQTIRDVVVNRHEWSLTGNPEFIRNIRSAIEQNVDVSHRVKIQTYKRTDKAVSLRYGRKSDIVALHDYLYQDATVYLDSKYQRFVEFFTREKKKGCFPDALRIPFGKPEGPECS